MGVLFRPANSMKKVIKWLLVVHTVAMFSFLTILLGITLNWVSLEYINNREFPNNDDYSPGPLGSSNIIDNGALPDIRIVMFPLNQWLADGLLVGLISNSVAWVFIRDRSSSCIVAMSFIT